VAPASWGGVKALFR